LKQWEAARRELARVRAAVEAVTAQVRKAAAMLE